MDSEEKKLLTLVYASARFDHLAAIGARTELRKRGDTPILEYVKDDPSKTQLFLEYVYVGNRIGNGILTGVLDKDIIFGTWGPRWWRNLWKNLEPLIKQERERRKDPELYDKFEKFIEQECQGKQGE